jgi:hypothetical protein
MIFSAARHWVLGTLFVFGVLQAELAGANDCHPALDSSKPQYIVGYGSLMQSASKRMSEPKAGSNLPIMVTGFQRAWNTHGVYPTTYLGVRPSKSARMVAALYRDFLNDGKLGADAREIDYCRVAIAAASIEMLDSFTVPSPSQIWIYVNKPGTLAPPDAQTPIVQSYVDIFITGCLELQTRTSTSSPSACEPPMAGRNTGSTTGSCRADPTSTSPGPGRSTST